MDPIPLPLRIAGLLAGAVFFLLWWSILYPRAARRILRHFHPFPEIVPAGGAPRCSSGRCWRHAVAELVRYELQAGRAGPTSQRIAQWRPVGHYCRRHLDTAAAQLPPRVAYRVNWLDGQPSSWVGPWSVTSVCAAIEQRARDLDTMARELRGVAP